MNVTRSKAKDRIKESRRGLTLSLSAPRPGPEILWLFAASALIAVGLFVVYRAKTAGLDELAAKIEKRELLDLNRVERREALLPALLGVYRVDADRQFAAQKIYDYLCGVDSGSANPRQLSHVGDLGSLRVTVEEIEKSPGLKVFRQRLEERLKNSANGHEVTSVPLLINSQIRDLKPLVVARAPGEFKSLFWFWAVCSLLIFYMVYFGWRILNLDGDPWLLPIIHLLSGIGFIVMVSLRDPLRDTLSFRNFAQGMIAGGAMMLLFSSLNYQRQLLPGLQLRKLSYIPLLLSFVLSLLLLILGTGPVGSDAKVNLWPGFQPVEVIKILIVLFLAGYFSARWERLRDLSEKRLRQVPVIGLFRWPRAIDALPVFAGLAIILVFFFRQSDLGPALVISCLFLSLYAVARRHFVMALVGLAIMFGGFYAGYLLGKPAAVVARVQMWRSPWDNPARGGEQLAHSLWALSSGGTFGAGLGQGDPSAIPAVHTDLVLAAVGEETGFAGSLVVFGLYVLLLWRGFRIALDAQGGYSFFLALGLTLITALQILLIAGGVLGVIPLSGVVSPFLSFGRSSMIANFIIFGVMYSIAARSGPKDERQKPPSFIRKDFALPVKALASVLGLFAVVLLYNILKYQALRADETAIKAALVLQGDGLRRFTYNPRLIEIARQIPRGAIYDRRGVPLATSDWKELEKHRDEYAQMGIQLDKAVFRSDRRHYPFGPHTFYLLGDLRKRLRWGAANAYFEEKKSNVTLQGYDDHETEVNVKKPGTEEEVTILKRDYRDLLPLLRRRNQPDHPDVRKVLDSRRDLTVSLDIRLQLRVAAILQTRLREAKSERGAIVVLDPDNGDLLASVSYPWPDEDRLVAADEESEQLEDVMVDRARYGHFPPGSTFKLVTAIAALNKSPTLANETFECVRLGNGRIGNKVKGWGNPIQDDVMDRTPHGAVNLEWGVIVSCNAYFAQLAVNSVKEDALLQTAQIFDIDVAKPNTPAQLRDALPQAAYGQGQVATSPLKMARVAATIANGGRGLPIRLSIAPLAPGEAAQPRILNPDLARKLGDAMRGVVTQGTGRVMSRSPIPIAGKTGTAEVKNAKSHAWFIGYAPNGAASKRIAFSVMIENAGYGATFAGPAAAEVVAAWDALKAAR